LFVLFAASNFLKQTVHMLKLIIHAKAFEFHNHRYDIIQHRMMVT